MLQMLEAQRRQLDQRLHAMQADEFFLPSCNRTKPGTARALAVDTDAKVLDGCSLPAEQRFLLGHSGCGNNWALGTTCALQVAPTSQASRAYGAIEQRRSIDPLLEGVRRAAEHCDGCPDMLLLHSLAGGTGSGLGSSLLEVLRDDWPQAYIGAVSVAPAHQGISDTPVQAINSTLALATLQDAADAVLLFDNSSLLRCCLDGRKLLRASQSGSYAHVNHIIAEGVVGLLWPLEDECLAGVSGLRRLVENVTCDPSTKFVEVRTSMATTSYAVAASTSWGSGSTRWLKGLQALQQAFPRFDVNAQQQPISTLAALLVARDMPTVTAGAGSRQSSAQGRSAASLFAKTWGVAADTVCICTGPLGLFGWQHNVAISDSRSLPVPESDRQRATPSLTAACVRSSTGSLMRHSAAGTVKLCSVGAYMHWYQQHGCEASSICAAAEEVSTLACQYAR